MGHFPVLRARVPRSLFRLGGVAAVLSNHPADRKIAKYRLDQPHVPDLMYEGLHALTYATMAILGGRWAIAYMLLSAAFSLGA